MTESEKDSASSDPLVIFRCEACGDTFPAHRGDRPACPTCKSSTVHEAHEPLL